MVITYLYHNHHNGSDICFVMFEGYMPIVLGSDFLGIEVGGGGGVPKCTQTRLT